MTNLFPNPIYLFGEVTPEKAQDVVQHLLEVKTKEATLLINSEGGDVASGFAIMDMIQYLYNHKQIQTRTVCVGEASSIAAVILASGLKGQRQASCNSRLLLHNITTTIDGNTDCTLGQVLTEAREAVKVNDLMLKQLVRTTKVTEEKWQTLLKDDLYFGPYLAIDYGIIDHILT